MYKVTRTVYLSVVPGQKIIVYNGNHERSFAIRLLGDEAGHHVPGQRLSAYQGSVAGQLSAREVKTRDESPFSVPTADANGQTYLNRDQSNRQTKKDARAIFTGRRSFHICVVYGDTEEMTRRFSVNLYERKEGCVYYGRRERVKRYGNGTLNRAWTTCRPGYGCSRANPLSGQVPQGRSTGRAQVRTHVHKGKEAGRRRTSLSQRYF